MTEKEFPKILYMSDVPVELSYAGATLMYRLLETYPSDRLLIIQGTEINRGRKLENVTYLINRYHPAIERLANSRFSIFAKYFKVLRTLFLKVKYQSKIQEFNPDIILTVSYGMMWLSALKLALKFKLRLFLIAHDDWITTENYGVFQKKLMSEFKKMFANSSSIFCICSNMSEYYLKLYNAKSDILYPLRGKKDIMLDVISAPKRNDNIVKFCYAGSLFTPGFMQMLEDIAKLIIPDQNELHIFSNVSSTEILKYPNLSNQKVFFHGLISPYELAQRMNSDMDVAILLNSFEQEEAFKYNFSSKIVDYISAGLPVLFWGAPTSGVISWVLKSGYKQVVTQYDIIELSQRVDYFKTLENRISCAKLLTDLGRECFSHEVNYNIFLSRVTTRS